LVFQGLHIIEEKIKVNCNKNYYQILSIDEFASDIEIKKSYRRLCFKYHPDRNSSENNNKKMKDINEAYAILSSKEKRALYDSLCKGKRAQEQRAQEQRAQEQRAQEQRAQEQRAQEQRAQEQRAQEQRAHRRSLNGVLIILLSVVFLLFSLYY